MKSFKQSNLHVHTYTPHQLSTTASRLHFALPTTATHNTTTLSNLQTSPEFTSFNIYPTTNTALPINDLLWQTAHSGSYNPTFDTLLGATVIALGLTPELHQFLTNVSLSEMHQAILDFLVLLHHQLTSDNDLQGLSRLREELIPSIWEQLASNIGIFENGEPPDQHRSHILEHVVQISFMTPWRVDVFAAYQSHTHPIPTNIQSNHSHPHPPSDLFAKLYGDWRVFDTLLSKRLRLPHRAVSEAMERAVFSGKSPAILEQAYTALQCHADPNSFFSKIPVHVIENLIVPFVVRRACEAIPPRKRKFISLKSLLELSAKFFEEIQQNTATIHDPDDNGDIISNLSLQPTVMADWVEDDDFHDRDDCLPDSHFSLESESIYPLERLTWDCENEAQVPDVVHVNDRIRVEQLAEIGAVDFVHGSSVMP